LLFRAVPIGEQPTSAAEIDDARKSLRFTIRSSPDGSDR
jgi:hypothetical protein